MIHVTRLNHAPLVLNSDLIEHIEVTPDTVITLTTGQKFMVLESAEENIDRVVAFRHMAHAYCPKFEDAADASAPRGSGEPCAHLLK
jgi:flagellar protein FlbD